MRIMLTLIIAALISLPAVTSARADLQSDLKQIIKDLRNSMGSDEKGDHVVGEELC